MAVFFVLGGARSGKSTFARSEAERIAGRDPSRRLVFIATAEARDNEMGERIARHRAERDGRWRTVEAPLALTEVVGGLIESDVAVIDCLTLWLTNVLLAGQDCASESMRLAKAVKRCPAQLVIVSNEVGFGIVPDNALARRFRDEAGRLHQSIAADAEQVALIVAGLRLDLKLSVRH